MEDPGFEHLDSDFDTRKSLHPVQRGLVKDWDMLESLWRIMLDDIGIVSSDTTSVCLTCLIILKICGAETTSDVFGGCYCCSFNSHVYLFFRL